jgi:hypothetical protein
MKKVLFILMLMVSMSILLAVESAPSETVGYFKKSVADGGWEVFSLPFGYASLSPNDVLGTQFSDFDTIIDAGTGDNSFYLTGSGWLGTIEPMINGHVYWINRATGNGSLDYYLLGTVNPSAVTLHVAGADQGSWYPFALNEAQPIDVNILPITGVMDFDTILDIATGDNSFYLTGSGWLGTVLNIEPTHGYWYNSYSATSFDWTYTPAARNAASGLGSARTHK